MPVLLRPGPDLRGVRVAAAGGGRQFATARDFAAWCGLTPREHSSAGKRRERGISRQGDMRLRKLFALGASTIMRNARSRADRATPSSSVGIERRPRRPATTTERPRTATTVATVVRGDPRTSGMVGTAGMSTCPSSRAFSTIRAPLRACMTSATTSR